MSMGRTSVYLTCSVLFILLTSVSCRKTKIGVWEVYRESGIFICSPEDESYYFGGKEKEYFTDKSCKDLGYTVKGSSEADHHFTSPDGETKPGRNGAFWNKYGKSGGSSNGAGCDLANYEGPEFNIQVDAQCKTAFLYDCAGNKEGVATACALYKEWDDGSGNFPDCPYCP